MVAAGDRKLLGLNTQWYLRTAVYLAGDCVEAETRDAAEIRRRRVYLDDIAMITVSRRIHPLRVAQMSVAFFCVLPALALTLIGALSGGGDALMTVFASAMAGFTLALFIQLMIHLIFKDNVITVFGRRHKIEMRYGAFKQKKCQESYALLVDAVRGSIETTNARLERERPPAPAVVEFAPPPPLVELTPIPPGDSAPPVVEAAPPLPFIESLAEPPAPQPAENAVPAPPPPFEERPIASEDGAHVEYNPRALPQRSPRQQPSPPPREPDLPFLPEIKSTPPGEKN